MRCDAMRGDVFSSCRLLLATIGASHTFRICIQKDGWEKDQYLMSSSISKFNWQLQRFNKHSPPHDGRHLRYKRLMESA